MNKPITKINMKLKNTFLVVFTFLTAISASAQLWVNRYNGQGDYSDRFTAVMTDVSGNVYLAGSTVISGNNQDILLLKLDANGNTVGETYSMLQHPVLMPL